MRGEYQFVDERLVAIELRPERGAVGGIERHLHRQLMEEVVAGMPGEPTLRDEGYTAYDLDALRVVLDTIDATIRFEEAL
ncbi:MAG: hypothetical protein QF464_02045 [Myxococcota bacterium]|nr:hypothetical protein [Myxococcota bacterium]